MLVSRRMRSLLEILVPRHRVIRYVVRIRFLDLCRLRDRRVQRGKKNSMLLILDKIFVWKESVIPDDSTGLIPFPVPCSSTCFTMCTSRDNHQEPTRLTVWLDPLSKTLANSSPRLVTKSWSHSCELLSFLLDWSTVASNFSFVFVHFKSLRASTRKLHCSQLPV